jgi:hypothetical protein
MTPSVVVQSSQLSVPSLHRDWGAISSFSSSLHLDTLYLLRHTPYLLTPSQEDSKRIQSAYLRLQRARTGYVYVYTLAIRGVGRKRKVGGEASPNREDMGYEPCTEQKGIFDRSFTNNVNNCCTCSKKMGLLVTKFTSKAQYSVSDKSYERVRKEYAYLSRATE